MPLSLSSSAKATTALLLLLLLLLLLIVLGSFGLMLIKCFLESDKDDDKEQAEKKP